MEDMSEEVVVMCRSFVCLCVCLWGGLLMT